jgi:hypothetical protein
MVCRTCGVFVGAFGHDRAVINLHVLHRSTDFTNEPVLVSAYNTEDVDARTARRMKNWMPATVEVG